ncbi:MAG: ABC transporter substrate-binding protein [Alphaproteobacteria bacterium]|nr:MAG: ABC transporter substrate-binding protein [Alphaproteobacteria bacterium]
MPRLRHARDETPAGAPPSRWVGPALQRTMRHQPTIRRQQQTRGFLHSRARQWACLLLVLPWLVAVPAGAEPLPVVRIGVLKFGTVNWELDVIRRHGLDRAHGFALEPTELAGKDGAAVALQGGAVDVILTDWLWVAKRRALGGDFTFAPHSHATGGLMVRRDAGIKGIADLKGRKIGIAGGPVDKSWLVLRAYAKKTAGLDLTRDAEPLFAAPPLLNEILKRADIPAAINFWQYNARLPQPDYFELVRVEDMLPALGVPPQTPLLGWVFSEAWAAKYPAVVRGFLAAAKAARETLAASPDEWQSIAPLVHADDAPMLGRLRQAYRRGISDAEADARASDPADAAQRLLELLTVFGGIDEAPPGGRVPRGTFFPASPS